MSRCGTFLVNLCKYDEAGMKFFIIEFAILLRFPSPSVHILNIGTSYYSLSKYFDMLSIISLIPVKLFF